MLYKNCLCARKILLVEIKFEILTSWIINKTKETEGKTKENHNQNNDFYLPYIINTINTINIHYYNSK